MQSVYINPTLNKEQTYQELIPQLESLLKAETNTIANMANVCAVLKTTFNWHWVGFYRVENNELVLGPFQGPLACTRIGYGKGVCGTSWKKAETQIVSDVNKFEGHIACSSLTQSEIVVPVFYNNTIIAVLDCDSEHLDDFDLIDKKYLETICTLIQ